MRIGIGVAAALLGLTACGQSVEDGEPVPSSRYVFWRPAPVLDAIEPAKVVEASTPADWRAVDPDNLLLLDLAGGSRVAIELSADFAPIHVANIRAFARSTFWKDAAIYRVQDNYVVQWGNNEAKVAAPPAVVQLPPPEYDRALIGLDIRSLGYPDSYAPMAGHADGWPIGYNPESGRAWLAHCYGMVGVGRDLAPDTGSGAELYAVIGHAPRALDRNIALVGRVIDGFPHMTALRRGTAALGFIEDPRQHTRITNVRLASMLPPAERPAYEVMRTDSAAFSAFVTGTANRGGEFFRVPAGGVDLCNVRVPTRKRPTA